MTDRIAIIGGGIMGLSCAWRLAQKGAQVTVYDSPSATKSASWAAAGMLGPTYESLHQDKAHPALALLCQTSAQLWPDFSDELEAASGLSIGYYRGPTLALALRPREATKLASLENFNKAERTGRDISMMSDRVIASKWLNADGWVNNRRVLDALGTLMPRIGVTLIPQRIDAGDADLRAYDKVLFTQGHAAGYGVKPVKGVMLAFARQGGLGVDYVIRCGAEYAVPRGEQLLIGATLGEVADPVSYLIDRAQCFLPAVADMPIQDHWSGYRPATFDHAPFLGQLADPRHFIAAGHYRNGILLAPITAQLLSACILGEAPPEYFQSFAPDRAMEAV